MNRIALAGKIIARRLSRAGLMEGVLGFTGDIKENPKKMDVYANDVLSRYSSKVDLSVAWLPRKWKTIHIPENCPVGRYTCFMTRLTAPQTPILI